jgi:hypothetical protein
MKTFPGKKAFKYVYLLIIDFHIKGVHEIREEIFDNNNDCFNKGFFILSST